MINMDCLDWSILLAGFVLGISACVATQDLVFDRVCDDEEV
jgi:hypothetical protein